MLGVKGGESMEKSASGKKNHVWWYLTLIIPFIATLFPSFYSSASPELWGIPFFYWYQFLWVAITAVLTGIVYWATK